MELTQKEYQVIHLSTLDKTVKEIANMTDRSVNTINIQIQSAKRKLGCNTIQGATAKLVRLGLITLITAVLIAAITHKVIDQQLAKTTEKCHIR